MGGLVMQLAADVISHDRSLPSYNELKQGLLSAESKLQQAEYDLAIAYELNDELKENNRNLCEVVGADASAPMMTNKIWHIDPDCRVPLSLCKGNCPPPLTYTDCRGTIVCSRCSRSASIVDVDGICYACNEDDAIPF